MSFKLTPEERRRIAGHDGYNAIDVMEQIVTSRWPRWVPCAERMPTAEDGVQWSTAEHDEDGEDELILWMVEGLGMQWAEWHSPPHSAIAWHPLAQWIAPPPVPTPEDKSRADFEAWYEANSERRRPRTERVFTEDAWRMWIAWEAGKAKAGTPDLLAALKALLTAEMMHETAMSHNDESAVEAANEAKWPAVDAAHAAIAKAEAGKAKGGAQL